MRSKSNNVYLQTSDYDVAPSRNVIFFKNDLGEKKALVVDFGQWMLEKGIEDFCREVNRSIGWQIDNTVAMLITHSHVDHIGMVPYFVRLGFRGPIYMTELCKWKCRHIWKDNMAINARYGDFYYGEENIAETLRLVKTIRVNETFELYDDSSVEVTATALDNAHLTDAVSYFVTFRRYGCDDNNILFTGDLKESSSIKNLSPIPDSIKNKKMTILLESTYGDTIRPELDDITETLFEREVSKCYNAGGNVVIPCITNDRTAEVVSRIIRMQKNGYISKRAKVFIKGELGRKLWNVLLNSSIDFRSDFSMSSHNIVFMDTSEVVPKGHYIMVVSPGMSQGGASLNAITRECTNRESLIIYTSYVPCNGVASKFINARKGEKIYIENHGNYEVNAMISQYKGFSGHNDLKANLRFLQQLKNVNAVICNHGSEKAISSQCEAISYDLGLEAYPASPKIAFRISPDGVKPIRHGAITSNEYVHNARKNPHPDIAEPEIEKREKRSKKKSKITRKRTRVGGKNHYKNPKRF